MSYTVVSKHHITDKGGKQRKATVVIDENAILLMINALIETGQAGLGFTQNGATLFGILVEEIKAP